MNLLVAIITAPPGRGAVSSEVTCIKEVGMRRHMMLMSALLLVAVFSLSESPADVTRTLRYELDPSRSFVVENLAGRMTVVPGGGGRIQVTATVHAESGRLADSVELELVGGGEDQHLRVRYPVDEYRKFQYPEEGVNTSVRYAGRKVRVNRTSGVLLYADVEIRVPRGEIHGKFRNAVGRIQGEEIEGRVTFDTGSGDVTLTDIRGDVTADTGSGDIDATDIGGAFNGDTGSGDIRLSRFRGIEIRCDTGSGSIEISDSETEALLADTGSGGVSVRDTMARRLNADTGSGNITFSGDGLEEIDADTGSGRVEIESPGDRLVRVNVDTGSGSLVLRMGPNASFEAIAEQGSGSIRNRYSDADPIIEGKEVIGYRRGSGRTRITFDTGSGNLVLEPAR